VSTAAPRPCTYPSCPNLVFGGARCERHRQIITRQVNQRRDHARNLYGSRWQAYRVGYLRVHPLCVQCGTHKRLVIDHKTPHKGDLELFWDPANHQTLCKACHDSKTARHDGGFGNQRRA
jgi:5-methylcytosine-specific restriction protein A